MSIRVLVADDQALVREGLMTLLAVAPDIEPVGAARDGAEAVAMAARHRPDVVLMDLRMPGVDGVQATREIRAAQPSTQIVVLTTYADETSILDALQAGARGYLTKDAGIAEISRACRRPRPATRCSTPPCRAACWPPPARVRAPTRPPHHRRPPFPTS
jgi:DNA-binding NarL/FixJ family response regulator